MMVVRVRRVCRTCGNPITWQRRWSQDRYRLEYCSEECRLQNGRPDQRRLEDAILELLEARASGASVCPSEVARRLAPNGDWRALMEGVRQAARRLQRAGVIEITQKGRPVDLSRNRGPIRLRLKPSGAIQA